MLGIPQDFALSVAEREGEPGRVWVESLPDLIDEFLGRWRCTPIAPISHGKVGVIVPVQRDDDGVPAVFKISFRHPGNRYEAEAFATWDGQGAVLLYERDDAQFAMLLEQAEWQTLDDLGDIDEATAVIGQLARRLAVPAPPHLPRLADRVDEWDRTLREDTEALGHPLSEQALSAALATIRDLGRRQPDTMVHGDLHFGNVVPAQREPWLVIDPKGLAGDLASDSFRVLVRGADSLLTADDLETELLRRLSIFADAAEIERERAIRWAQLDSLIGAYYSRKFHAEAWIIRAHDLVTEILAGHL